MAERPEDLNLPIAVVQRIIKESLPDGVIVSKEARQTISRASSVFVLYLTACAVTHANKAKRKTLAINDILAAINEMEFDSFIQPLNEALKYRKEHLAQSAKTAKSKSNANKPAADEDDEAVGGDEEEVEEIDVDQAEGAKDADDDAEEVEAGDDATTDKSNHDESNSALNTSDLTTTNGKPTKNPRIN